MATTDSETIKSQRTKRDASCTFLMHSCTYDSFRWLQKCLLVLLAQAHSAFCTQCNHNLSNHQCLYAIQMKVSILRDAPHKHKGESACKHQQEGEQG